MYVDLVAELEELDDAALTEEFRQMEAHDRARAARWAALVDVIDRRKVWRADGHASLAGWCRTTGRWSEGDITRRKRVAKLCDTVPEVGDALLDGSVGVAQVAVLAKARANQRCGDQIVDVIETFLEHAPKLPYSEFSIVVDRWERLTDLDGAHRDAEASHERRDAIVSSFDGVQRLIAQGGAIEAAAMAEIFAKFVDAEFMIDWELGKAQFGDDVSKSLLARTDAQRRFDALFAIFLAAVAVPTNARRPEPLVNIVVDLNTWEDVLARKHLLKLVPGRPPVDVVRRYCETVSGVPLTPDEVFQAAIAGHVRRVVFDADGTVINLGRRARLFPGSAAEAVKLRCRRCTYAGCEVPSARCQSDHLVEFSKNGRTDQRNGAPACGRHNRWRNRGYRVECDDDGIWHTYRPNGTEIC